MKRMAMAQSRQIDAAKRMYTASIAFTGGRREFTKKSVEVAMKRRKATTWPHRARMGRPSFLAARAHRDGGARLEVAIDVQRGKVSGREEELRGTASV